MSREPRSITLRGLVYQALALCILAVGVWVIAANTQANLQRLGVVSSPAFFVERAGFEINQKLIAFDANSSIARAAFVAALNTVLLGVVTILGASLLGLIVGVARTSRNALLRGVGAGYVEIFRNIPVLLQIFFWYFIVLRWLPPVSASLSLFDAVFLNNRGLFLPTLHIVDGALRWVVPVAERFSYRGGYVVTPEFLALLIGLSMYNASYIAEIVRSSLQTLPRGQVEAAHALGLSRFRTLQLVLLPQALKVILPPLATVYQNVFKGTALGAAIAYPEITSVLVGTVNNIVGQPVIIMSVVLMVYLAFSMGIALLMHWYEARTRRWG